jgi:hypothetical protein
MDRYPPIDGPLSPDRCHARPRRAPILRRPDCARLAGKHPSERSRPSRAVSDITAYAVLSGRPADLAAQALGYREARCKGSPRGAVVSYPRHPWVRGRGAGRGSVEEQYVSFRDAVSHCACLRWRVKRLTAIAPAGAVLAGTWLFCVVPIVVMVNRGNLLREIVVSGVPFGLLLLLGISVVLVLPKVSGPSNGGEPPPPSAGPDDEPPWWPAFEDDYRRYAAEQSGIARPGAGAAPVGTAPAGDRTAG